jgi:hypothetical protein
VLAELEIMLPKASDSESEDESDQDSGACSLYEHCLTSVSYGHRLTQVHDAHSRVSSLAGSPAIGLY